MTSVLLASFFIQGVAMFFDEFYFHRKRGLPRWEKIGHPLDTFSVLVCYLFLFYNQYSQQNLWVYLGLCIFSSLFITKDEFVHTQKCSAGENWLHAFLFVIHPVTFFAAGVLWLQAYNKNIFMLQSTLVAAFMLYQIVYWGVYDKNRS